MYIFTTNRYQILVFDVDFGPVCRLKLRLFSLVWGLAFDRGVYLHLLRNINFFFLFKVLQPSVHLAHHLILIEVFLSLNLRFLFIFKECSHYFGSESDSSEFIDDSHLLLINNLVFFPEVIFELKQCSEGILLQVFFIDAVSVFFGKVALLLNVRLQPLQNFHLQIEVGESVGGLGHLLDL